MQRPLTYSIGESTVHGHRRVEVRDSSGKLLVRLSRRPEFLLVGLLDSLRWLGVSFDELVEDSTT